MSSLGSIHTFLAFAAIIFGGFVVFWRKGTGIHKLAGWAYFASMAGLNVTALFIYNLLGTFGAFHWFALASLIVIAAGIVPAIRKKPAGGWLFLHAEFMCWSYLGLLAAAVSEITTRLLQFPFGWTVAVTSLLVLVIGGIILKKTVPVAISALTGGRRV